jgi:hypothetical protein
MCKICSQEALTRFFDIKHSQIFSLQVCVSLKTAIASNFARTSRTSNITKNSHNFKKKNYFEKGDEFDNQWLFDPNLIPNHNFGSFEILRTHEISSFSDMTLKKWSSLSWLFFFLAATANFETFEYSFCEELWKFSVNLFKKQRTLLVKYKTF